MAHPKVPTFDEIEALQKTFGPRLRETRKGHGMSLGRFVEYLVKLGSDEIIAWQTQLKHQKFELEEQIEQYAHTLRDLEELKKVDKTTVGNWENNRPVPSSAAVEIIAKMFFPKAEQQQEKNDFIKLADNTRRLFARSDHPRIDREDTFGGKLDQLRDDAGYSKKEFAELFNHEVESHMQLGAEMLTPDEARQKIIELKSQHSKLSQFGMPNYIIVDGVGSEKTYQVADIDGHAVGLVEAGAFPSADLYKLLKDTLRYHQALPKGTEEALDQAYEHLPVVLARGGIDIRKYLDGHSQKELGAPHLQPVNKPTVQDLQDQFIDNKIILPNQLVTPPPLFLYSYCS